MTADGPASIPHSREQPSRPFQDRATSSLVPFWDVRDNRPARVQKKPRCQRVPCHLAASIPERLSTWAPGGQAGVLHTQLTGLLVTNANPQA